MSSSSSSGAISRQVDEYDGSSCSGKLKSTTTLFGDVCYQTHNGANSGKYIFTSGAGGSISGSLNTYVGVSDCSNTPTTDTLTALPGCGGSGSFISTPAAPLWPSWTATVYM